MNMTVQDRLSAKIAHDPLERRRVREAAQGRRNPRQRRMMNEHDPRQAPGACLAQEFGESLDLRFAQLACRHEGSGRHR
jgi:hypothetical protein